MKCCNCGGIYNEATGHCLSAQSRLCHVCAGRFLAWVITHTGRRWGGLSFYDYAATSVVAP